MKQSYFLTSPEGILLMPGDTMPIEPLGRCEVPHSLCVGKPHKCLCNDEAHEYNKALQAAKASAIPIQNIEVAKKLIGEQIASLNPGAVGPTFIQPGAIYGPFTVEYEIRYKTPEGIHLKSKRYFKHGETMADLKEGIPYAILLPAPEKEPQEDIYAEVIRLARMGPASQEEYIKRNFTITRKQ